MIFRRYLKQLLEQNECVITDKGYSDSKVVNPYGLQPHNAVMCGKFRARHKCINGRFKQFAVMKNVFRHGRELHGMMFYAVVNIGQAAFVHHRSPYYIE